MASAHSALNWMFRGSDIRASSSCFRCSAILLVISVGEFARYAVTRATAPRNAVKGERVSHPSVAKLQGRVRTCETPYVTRERLVLLLVGLLQRGVR